jgi:phage gp36-like protein
MKNLSAPTEDFVKIESGQLAADASAGSSVTLTLINNDGLALHDFIVIGYEGNELAEIVQIDQAVTPGTSIRVATLKLTHKSGEPVTKYRYNQRKFYGSTASNGTFTELVVDGSPVNIQPDDPQAATIEYTGAEGYTYFKATYFNSQTSEETDINESDAALADESKRYCSIYVIRRQAGFSKNPRLSDDRIEMKRKQAESEINSALFARYILPLSVIPAIVSQICEMLAAGYIEYEEFGADGDGGKKLGEARANLKKIMDGTQRLLDANFDELPRNTKTGVLDGYPNSTETDAAVFSMTDKY